MNRVVFKSIASVVLLVVCELAAATSPEWATTTQAVERAPNLTYASHVLRASGESSRLDAASYVTIFLPTDLACASYLKSRLNPDAAKRFVLSRSFAGQINVVDQLDKGVAVKINHVRPDGAVVSVKEGGEMLIRNLMGEPVTFSVRDGRVLLGGHAVVSKNTIVVTKTGSLGLLDDCGPL